MGLRAFLPLLALLSLSGCMGGSLSDTSEFEMFPHRAATKSEAKDLKQCLRAARAAQEKQKHATGHYFRRMGDLGVDSACDGYRLGQNRTATGYEISAEKREDETSVKWSVNEKGVIEEHLDPEGEPDLEL